MRTIEQVRAELNDVITDWLCTEILSEEELHMLWGKALRLKQEYLQQLKQNNG